MPYYYGDNLNRNVNDVGYKVGDPSSVNIVVEVPSNRQSTGAPIISYLGDLEAGTTLTADVSNIQDADGLSNVSYTYQWYRVLNGVETQISGATSSTYKVDDVNNADDGYRLKVRVKFFDDLCNEQALDSALTGIVGGTGTQVTPVGTIEANPPSITEGQSKTFKITMTPCPDDLTKRRSAHQPDRQFHHRLTGHGHAHSHLQPQPGHHHTDSQY